MEVDIIPPMAVFTDCLAHASSVAAHPLQFSLLCLGLYPGRRRYRRNFETLYNFHKGTHAPSPHPDPPCKTLRPLASDLFQVDKATCLARC